MILQIVLWASAAWLAFGALGSIALIGKERKPTTAGVAIVVVVTTGIIVAALIAAALQLNSR